MRSASIEKEMVATLLRHIRREAEAEDRAVLVAAFRPGRGPLELC